MKNTALILLLGFAILGCDNMEKKAIGPLSYTETQALSGYSSSIESALLAIDGAELFERGDSKLSKSASDWLQSCDYSPTYDSRNRINGRTVGGAMCPIRAEWKELADGNNGIRITIAYTLIDLSFGDIIPVTRLTIKGTRTSDIEDGKIVSMVNYTGTSRDLNDDVGTFTAVRSEIDITNGLSIKPMPYKYDLSVKLRDFSFKGNSVQDGGTFVNGSKISADEFQTLFFVLK